MEWSDEAIVLSARRHGEAHAIVHVLTAANGRHAGLLHGGAGGRAAPVVQPGNCVSVTWRGRLADSLGTFACELQAAPAAGVLHDPLRLAAIASACALLDVALPEREPHPGLYARSLALLSRIDGPEWGMDYVRWEAALLADLGYGLDLTGCAVTGRTEDLAFVSPRSARAVSRGAVSAGAAAPYEARLLALPPFLLGQGTASAGDIADGLRLTGHFLARHVFALLERPLPDARERLVARWERAAGPQA